MARAPVNLLFLQVSYLPFFHFLKTLFSHKKYYKFLSNILWRTSAHTSLQKFERIFEKYCLNIYTKASGCSGVRSLANPSAVLVTQLPTVTVVST